MLAATTLGVLTRCAPCTHAKCWRHGDSGDATDTTIARGSCRRGRPRTGGLVRLRVGRLPASAADTDAARRLDASTPGQGWTCFGNAGIGRGAGWVAAWAPGADETLLDPGLGYSM